MSKTQPPARNQRKKPGKKQKNKKTTEKSVWWRSYDDFSFFFLSFDFAVTYLPRAGRVCFQVKESGGVKRLSSILHFGGDRAKCTVYIPVRLFSLTKLFAVDNLILSQKIILEGRGFRKKNIRVNIRNGYFFSLAFLLDSACGGLSECWCSSVSMSME